MGKGHPRQLVCYCCGKPALTAAATLTLLAVAESEPVDTLELAQVARIAPRTVRRVMTDFGELFLYGPWAVVNGTRRRTYKLSRYGRAAMARLRSAAAE